jgi:hypothetical protein
MDGTIVSGLQFVISRKSVTKKNNKLLDEIEAVKLRIETVQAHFDYQTDPDLIESCVFEMKSLMARYQFLLREAKKNGITCEAASNVGNLYHF